MKTAIVIKKTKIHDRLTLPKGYTGYVEDETISYFIFHCYEINKNVLIDKKNVKIL